MFFCLFISVPGKSGYHTGTPRRIKFANDCGRKAAVAAVRIFVEQDQLSPETIYDSHQSRYSDFLRAISQAEGPGW